MAHRLTRPAAVALVLAATVTIFEPLKSALFNWAELTVGLAALLGALASPFVWCALGAVVLFVGCALISARYTLALLVALLLAVSIQGSFFVWDYGPFDGRLLDWQQLFGLGVLDAVVWLMLLTFAIFRPAALAARAGASGGAAGVRGLAAFGQRGADGAGQVEALVRRQEGADDDHENDRHLAHRVAHCVGDVGAVEAFADETEKKRAGGADGAGLG